MGWLFAVALGLQEKDRRAVFAALPPIALGHVISVGAIVALVALAQERLPANELRIGAAAILIAFGLYRAVRARHFRWVGMRVGFWGLTAWSLLMATGHGAGLMLIPFLTGAVSGGIHPVTMGAMSQMGTVSSTAHVPAGDWVLAVAVHTFGYLATMTAVALVIYDKVGVHVLRTAWFNFDLAWAVALVISGVLMLVL
jgi:hypothetical protein